MIHPTAVIHPSVELGQNVRVGPYCVIDGGVQLGDGCELGPHVYLTGNLRAGAGNRFHAGCVIGDLPQDLRFKGEPTEVIIGEQNTFREGVTVHRSNKPSEATRIGSHNFLMANSHIGHNTCVGNHVVIANGALLGGHVTVGDRVFISGNCMIHQFVRIGSLALMQGGSGASKDLPPYTIAVGNNHICGLNTIGLRRAGISSEERLELRRLYHLLFRSGEKLRVALEKAKAEFQSAKSRELLDFLESGTRGFCSDISRANGSDE